MRAWFAFVVLLAACDSQPLILPDLAPGADDLAVAVDLANVPDLAAARDLTPPSPVVDFGVTWTSTTCGHLGPQSVWRDDGVTRGFWPIWGSAPDDYWGARSDSTLFHYDGARWSSLPTCLTERVRSISGSGRCDVWMVGGATILHWDCVELSSHHLPISGLTSVWSVAPNDVWAVGAANMAHWDGRSWAVLPPPVAGGLVGVSGTASDDVWVSGPTALAHYDGTRWRDDSALVNRTIRPVHGRVWAFSRTNVWLEMLMCPGDCDYGPAYRFDGTSWTPIYRLGVLWAQGRDLWLGAESSVSHFDGNTWTDYRASAWYGLWGTSQTDI